MVRDVLVDHGAFLLLVGGFLGVTLAAGLRVRPAFPLMVLAIAVPLVVLFEVTRLRWKYTYRGRPGGPLSSRDAWRRVGWDLRVGVLSPGRLLQAVLVLTAVTVFMDSFTVWKQAMPRFTTYRWDEAFAMLDASVHGGADPWRLTHLFFGGAWITRLIDVIYVSWYAVFGFTVIGVAFARPSPLRNRFLLTFALAQILLGTGLAYLFASGGPVYFEHFTGGARFDPLLERLGSMDLRATFLQAVLLEGFTGASDFPGEGISAMPSMHVAVAALIALLAGSRDGRLGLVAWAYAAAILLGSVHLGWHYAIDGYIAIAATAGLWYGVWRVQRWNVEREMRQGSGSGRAAAGASLP